MIDDEALAWLKERCPITTSKIGLARQWGWDDMRVHRRWIRWQNEKHITVVPADDGKRYLLTWIGDGEKAKKRVTHPSHAVPKPKDEVLTPAAPEPSQDFSPPSHSIEKAIKKAQDSSARSIEKGIELLSEKVPPKPDNPKLLTDLMGRCEKGRENPLLKPEKDREKPEMADEKGEEDFSLPSHTSGNVLPFRQRDHTANLALAIDTLKEDIRQDIQKTTGKAQPDLTAPATKRDHSLIVCRLMGVLVAFLAAAMAYQAMRINWVYGASLGEDRIYAYLGLIGDAVALAMPTAALLLKAIGKLGLSRWARFAWFLTIVWAAMSTLGFAALNIERSTAGGEHAATRYAGLREQVERLRTQRAAITETRSVAALETAAVAALSEVSRAKVKSTSGCTDVTIPSSAEACEPVLSLKRAQDQARRRDDLDERLRAAERAYAEAKPVKTADPLPGTLAGLLNWALGWLIVVTPHDVEMARLIILASLPLIAGRLFEMAASLCFCRQD